MCRLYGFYEILCNDYDDDEDDGEDHDDDEDDN